MSHDNGNGNGNGNGNEKKKSDGEGRNDQGDSDNAADTLQIPSPVPELAENEVDRILRKTGVPSFFPAAGGGDLDSALDALRPDEGEELVLDAEAEAEAADAANALFEGRMVQDQDAHLTGPGPAAASDPTPSIMPPRTLPPDPDPGATSARRRLPRRARADARPTLAGFDAAADRARAELLMALAADDSGAARAELLVGAAELFERLGEGERALAAYRQAHDADATDPIALRELRKQALIERDWSTVSKLIAAEATLPLGTGELALLELAQAEVQRTHLDAPEAATEAARRAAALAPAGLWPQLMLAQLEPDARGAADALERAAQCAATHDDFALASALRLSALRRLKAAGDHEQALASGRRALAEPGATLTIALESLQSALAQGDSRTLEAALERLAKVPDGEIGETFARALALVAQPSEAALAPSGRRSLPSARMRALMSMRPVAGDAASATSSEERASAAEDALQAWQQASVGLERALASIELSRWAVLRGDGSRAQALVQQAREAAPDLLLIELAERAALRTEDARHSLVPRPAESEDVRARHALEDAARLASAEDATGDELELLAGAPQDQASARTVLVDAALQNGSPERAFTALELDLGRASGPPRIGATLALARSMRTRAHELEGGGIDALQAIERTGSAAAPHWLALARSHGGSFGAFAATLAGDLLRAEGGSREPYEVALATAPGYPPACWALEEVLHVDGDRDALQRTQRALARGSSDPVERAARLLRAAALIEGRSPEDAAALRREARAAKPGDSLMPSPIDGDPRARREALERIGERSDSALAITANLRAAALHEDEGKPARAAAIYRAVLDRAPGDPHAQLGLERTLEQSGLRALLGARREQLAHALEDESARAEVLEQLAWEHMAAGDEASALASFRALREAAPYSVPALRALERHAMTVGDDDLLSEVAGTLADTTRDPRERAAQSRLAVRAGAQRGDEDPQLGLWHALRTERAARQRADLGSALGASAVLADHFKSPIERASWLMRCATVAEQTQPAEALELLRQAARRAPTHPLVHEQLARLAQAAGESAEAARAYEAAAEGAPSHSRAAHLWYRAGRLWEQLADTDRARRALEHAAATDLDHRDVFARLRRLLEAASEHRALAALLERRLEGVSDPEQVAELQVERSGTLAKLGEREPAKRALALALEAAPLRTGAMRALADLQLQDTQFAEAAATLIKLARSSDEPDVLRRAFLDLGDIYERHLPDLRRAEIAYTRALSIEPDDVEAIERLVEVFAERGVHDRALRAAKRLIELAQNEDAIDQATVRLCGLLSRFGEREQAQRLLDERWDRRPTEPALITAIADLHDAQLDHAALVVHLDRSTHALRSAIVNAPGSSSLWSTLVSALSRRERPAAAEAAANMAVELGVADEATRAKAAGLGALGPAALSEAALQDLWPEGLPQAARSLIQWLGPRADALLPVRAGESAPADETVHRQALQQAAQWLACDAPALRVVEGARGVPLHGHPPTLAFDDGLLSGSDLDELAFLVARGLAAIKLGLWPAARSTGAALAALTAAVSAIATESQRAGDERSETGAPALMSHERDARARIESLRARDRKALQGLVFDAIASGQADASALPRLCMRASARVALAASGKLAPALRALHLAASIADPDGDAVDALAAVAAGGEARDLLHFALSDAHLDLRART